MLLPVSSLETGRSLLLMCWMRSTVPFLKFLWKNIDTLNMSNNVLDKSSRFGLSVCKVRNANKVNPNWCCGHKQSFL